MKHKLSISIGKESVKKIEALLLDGRFRNKSHVVEFALKMLDLD